MTREYKVGLVGVGAVGSEMIKVLKERHFPCGKVQVFASRERDEVIAGETFHVMPTTKEVFKDLDIALFAGGTNASLEYRDAVVAGGAVMIDNSRAFRQEPDVPLVVPEVNPEAVKDVKKGIIANPNCSTIQAMLPIKALHDKYGIKRIVYSTYQAVSGAGMKGINDLKNGMAGNDTCVAFPHPIAGNCLPQIDVFLDNGYTKEEMKMINETHKILGDDTIPVTATCVRVPVFDSHSESINVELKTPFESIDEIRECFAAFPGIVVQDDPANSVYPLAREAAGKNEVFVGRIRRDFSVENGINFWCVSDNIRKGAATNTVQIAETLIKED
ncbi:MAG: aspartate-semialdehyde dehydrogenase [Firmicutes bacterium]|nr:aspartate-semialdehyde dehydrogenase [Bacillota bacterium]